MLRIGAVSKKLNMSVDTIRYYTDEGMVPSLKHDDNGQRLFDEEAIEWLSGTQYLRELGMTIKDIKKYNKLCLDDSEDAIRQRHQLILKQYDQAQENLLRAQKTVAWIQKKITFEEGILNHQYPDFQNPARKHNK